MNRRKKNLRLKAAIVLRFDCQADAALTLRMDEARLSRIINGRMPPSEKERKAFARVFGLEQAESLLKGEERLDGPQFIRQATSRVLAGVENHLASEAGSMVILAGTSKSPKESKE